MEITSITINKWESFQPRKDRSNHTWFRVENTIAFSETLHGLSADQKWFWICLLAYASKKNSGEIAANWSYFETTFGVTTKRMKEALISIEAHGAVTLSYDTERLPLATDRWTNASLQTDRQTDKQTCRTEFDFDSLYALFPRKEGKAAGMTRLRKRIKTQEEFDRFASAVRRYASLVKVEGRKREHILLWSSFVGTDGAERWLDHVPATITPPTPVPQTSGAFFQEPEPSEKPLTPEESSRFREQLRERFGKAGA